MLKYLFTAEYSDGTKLQQTQDDVSKKDENRSATYDIEHEKLVKFTLDGDGHRYSVDLIDGHFEIDAVPFRTHPGDVAGLKLVYFRHHSVTMSPVSEIAHKVSYVFGWEDHNGDKRVIEIW